jgi:hypothetical protein
MHCFEMQDWVTIRGASVASSTIAESEHQWLDLSDYRDVTLWTEVKAATIGAGAVTITFETCPTKDDSMFAVAGTPFSAATGVTVTVVHRDTATVPLARWLRWKITQSGAGQAWDVVFRVWVSAAGKTSGRVSTHGSG